MAFRDPAKQRVVHEMEEELARANRTTVPKLRESLSDAGQRIQALSIVEFHDTDTSARWFNRPHHVVAYIAAVMAEGGEPLHMNKLLAQVRSEFGPNAEVIW